MSVCQPERDEEGPVEEPLDDVEGLHGVSWNLHGRPADPLRLPIRPPYEVHHKHRSKEQNECGGIFQRKPTGRLRLRVCVKTA